MDYRHLEQVAEALGISTAEAEALIARGLADARRAALESLDSEGIPPEVVALAQMAEAATGARIAAIKAASDRVIEPERPVRSLLDWQIRRTEGRLTPADPKPVERTLRGFAFITEDNPVDLEGWFTGHGLRASAFGGRNGFGCFVEWPKPGK